MYQVIAALVHPIFLGLSIQIGQRKETEEMQHDRLTVFKKITRLKSANSFREEPKHDRQQTVSIPTAAPFVFTLG